MAKNTVHTRIMDELSDGELRTLYSLLSNRRITITKAIEWLRDRGHTMSKSAVARYVQRFRAPSKKPVFAHLVNMGISTEDEMRSHIQQASRQLQGEELAHLAVFSAYLLTISGAGLKTAAEGVAVPAALRQRNEQLRIGIDGSITVLDPM